MNKKKLLKIGVVLFTLLALTGCEAKVGSGFFGFLTDFCTSIYMGFLGFVGNMNAFFAALVQLSYSVPQNMSDYIKELMSFFSGGFGKVITITQILAIVAIVIQFAKSVVKSNINGDGIGTSPISYLKKIVVGALAAFLIPYICISGFMLSTYASVGVSQLFVQESEDQMEAWKIYDEMAQDHVFLGTMCQKGQEEVYGVSNVDAWFGTNEDFTPQKGNYKIIRTDSDRKSVTGETLQEKYCSTGETTIFNTLRKSEKYSKAIVIGTDSSSLTEGDSSALGFGEVLSGSGGAFLALIIGVIYFFIIIGTLGFMIISTCKRILDMIVLLAASFWYIGASVSDSPQQSSIGELAKKLLSICLTNFLILFEYLLFVVLVLSKGFTLLSVMIGIAFFLVLTSTPTAVEEMVQSTNTLESGKSLLSNTAAFLGRLGK